MSRTVPVLAIIAGLIGGCAGTLAQKPVEMLDEHTGVTVAALQAPIELDPREVLVMGTRASFAFLGPVEWNRMGAITYGLWIHVAPAGGREPADLHEPAVLSVVLDDGTVDLRPASPPSLGREPYRPAEPWGPSAYFNISVRDLKRMAASPHLALRCLARDGTSLEFKAPGDTRPVLAEFLRSRGLTGD